MYWLGGGVKWRQKSPISDFLCKFLEQPSLVQTEARIGETQSGFPTWWQELKYWLHPRVYIVTRKLALKAEPEPRHLNVGCMCLTWQLNHNLKYPTQSMFLDLIPKRNTFYQPGYLHALKFNSFNCEVLYSSNLSSYPLSRCHTQHFLHPLKYIPFEANNSHSPRSLAITQLLFVLIALYSPECRMNEIIQYVAFLLWCLCYIYVEE